MKAKITALKAALTRRMWNTTGVPYIVRSAGHPDVRVVLPYSMKHPMQFEIAKASQIVSILGRRAYCIQAARLAAIPVTPGVLVPVDWPESWWTDLNAAPVETCEEE